MSLSKKAVSGEKLTIVTNTPISERASKVLNKLGYEESKEVTPTTKVKKVRSEKPLKQLQVTGRELKIAYYHSMTSSQLVEAIKVASIQPQTVESQKALQLIELEGKKTYWARNKKAVEKATIKRQLRAELKAKKLAEKEAQKEAKKSQEVVEKVNEVVSNVIETKKAPKSKKSTKKVEVVSEEV